MIAPQVHILLAASLYPPDIGGPATYARSLELELEKRGVPITVVPFREVRHLPKLVRHLTYTWRLWRAAKHATHLYALDPVSVGIPVRLVSWLTKKPYLLRLGGDYAWEQGWQRFGLRETLDAYTENRRLARWPVRVMHRLQAAVAMHAQYVVVPSEYFGSIVATWGVAPEQVAVILSALQAPPRGASRETARQNLGLAAGVYTVVTGGRLVRWKGVREVISAIAELRAAGVPAALFVFGDGEERVALETVARERGVGELVTFTGALGRAELGELLTAADVFVLNTAYEGRSHQLLEAMGARVPIVTSDIGGNRELIEDGVTGLLVPYANAAAIATALRTVYEQPAAAHRRAETARATVGQFTEHDSVDAFLRLLTPAPVGR